MIICGNTVGTTVPQPDYNEQNPASAAFIRNKPDAAIAKAQATADAAKTAAEGAFSQIGGDVSGPMRVQEPLENANPATKGYVDQLMKRRHLAYDLTLAADRWTGTGPYTQTIALDGILAADRPHYGIVYSENREAEKEAFALLDDLDTADGSVTFTCFEDKPEGNLTIQLEVNR